MVDGWAGIAAEILMLNPLIFYHLKNFFKAFACQVVSHVTLIGLLSTKHLAPSALLVALAVLTIWFYTFCKAQYEPAFVRYPLQCNAIIWYSHQEALMRHFGSSI
ncbi:hypothetical protein V6N13_120087 [Hibiscus sabdariffa]